MVRLPTPDHRRDISVVTLDGTLPGKLMRRFLAEFVRTYESGRWSKPPRGPYQSRLSSRPRAEP
ncbi:unnamed protein product [Fusarium graminearum]|uniref:Uncharacterized protein n=1 Tax=Gibberella zeae TaxID=5518 RepID=A0A8H3JF08_GIBZA|nr:unnamed protein product [Fusarium graminearum]CAG2011036.1 unnamed protein product [Fusarium graminearum]